MADFSSFIRSSSKSYDEFCLERWMLHCEYVSFNRNKLWTRWDKMIAANRESRFTLRTCNLKWFWKVSLKYPAKLNFWASSLVWSIERGLLRHNGMIVICCNEVYTWHLELKDYCFLFYGYLGLYFPVKLEYCNASMHLFYLVLEDSRWSSIWCIYFFLSVPFIHYTGGISGFL